MITSFLLSDFTNGHVLLTVQQNLLQCRGELLLLQWTRLALVGHPLGQTLLRLDA